MKNKCFLSLLVCVFLLVSNSLSAQRNRNAAQYAQTAYSVVSKYKKEMAQAAGKMKLNDNDTVLVAMSPYLYRLLGPGVYYRSALSDRFHLAYNKNVILLFGASFYALPNSLFANKNVLAHFVFPSVCATFVAVIDCF